MHTCREPSPLRIMKRVWSFILLGFLIESGSNSALGQAKGTARIFTPALKEIQSKTRIPILLPSKLPPAISESGIKLASGEVTKDGYFITLYYSKDAKASYAAGFGGSRLFSKTTIYPTAPGSHCRMVVL